MGKELASIDPTTKDGLANLATGGLSGQFNAVGDGLARIGDKIDDNLLGGNEEDAAKEAARQQEEVGRLALQQQKEATEQIRGDLEPFRTLGSDSIPLLQGAVNDPSARVLSNPFFQAMAADQEQRLMASAAARGKLGSGGANDDLQRNLLLLGNQFGQQDVTNLANLTTIGANAAAQTGTATQQGATAAGGILSGIGNAQAAGTIGAANARSQGVQNLIALGTGVGSYFSGGQG
jgi:hypothetical protein